MITECGASMGAYARAPPSSLGMRGGELRNCGGDTPHLRSSLARGRLIEYRDVVIKVVGAARN